MLTLQVTCMKMIITHTHTHTHNSTVLTSDAVQVTESILKLFLRIIFRKHSTQLCHQRIKSLPLSDKTVVQRRMVLPAHPTYHSRLAANMVNCNV